MGRNEKNDIINIYLFKFSKKEILLSTSLKKVIKT